MTAPDPGYPAAAYTQAPELCSSLMLLQEELAAERRIPEIFTVIFAAEKTVLQLLENGKIIRTIFFPELASSPGWVNETPSLSGPRTDSGGTFPDLTPSGFRLQIPGPDGPAGILELYGTAFRDYSGDLPLALVVAEVCGAVLTSLRARRQNGEEPRSGAMVRKEPLKRGSADREIAMARLREVVRQYTAREEKQI